MSQLVLRKAERKQAKLRIGVSGPSGSGKTYSGLLLAKGMSSSWEKVALIDTENGSGELYSDLGAYNVIKIEAPFTPERYIEAIKMCEEAGMESIVIDSASHEWDGKGGCLEIQESLGGRYQDWAKVTPRHQKFIQAILESPVHIITTTRRKQDYDMTKDGSGKTKVEKVGLKEVQREGFEYELTLSFEVDTRHMAKASKDRTGLFADKPEEVITEATGQKIKAWADAGAPAKDYTKVKAAIKKELGRMAVPPKTQGEAKDLIMTLTGLDFYNEENLEDILTKLKTVPMASDEPLETVAPEQTEDDGSVDTDELPEDIEDNAPVKETAKTKLAGALKKPNTKKASVEEADVEETQPE
jgi:hypothetical protein